MGPLGKLTVGAGIVLGGYAIHEWLKDRDATPAHTVSFKEFLMRQETIDHLNGKEIASWFREKTQGEEGSALRVLAFPTQKALAKFGVTDRPDGLDEKTNLLQFEMDTDTSRMTRLRLISFCTLSDKVAELFKDTDYVLVEEADD